MSTSSLSIYWNVWSLVQQVTGGTNCRADWHRHLRSQAYAILLDVEQEPYPDIPEDHRQLANAQAAAEEILRLRSAGRHGTAARISWRLDELAELNQHQQCGDNSIPRIVSFLFHLRGLGSGGNGGGIVGARIGQSNMRLDGASAAATTAAAAAPVPASGAVQMVVGPPGREAVGPLGGSSTAIAAVFDGIPMGRRLRLLPPSRPPPADTVEPTPTFPPLPQRLLAPSITLTAPVGGEVGPDSQYCARDLTSWFPFRDCAGLPLLPAFDAPLDDLLLRQDDPHLSRHVNGTAPHSLRRLTADAASRRTGGGGGGACAAHPLQAADTFSSHCGSSARMAALGEAPSAMPLLLGPLHQSLVHTRFHHLNPLLLRLSGTQSECFNLPVEEAEAAAVDGVDASRGVDDFNAAADVTVEEGEAAELQDGDGPTVLDLPAPFALAALGVGREHRLALSLIPPQPLSGPGRGMFSEGTSALLDGPRLKSNAAATVNASSAVDRAVGGYGVVPWFRSQQGGFKAYMAIVAVPPLTRWSRPTRSKVPQVLPGLACLSSSSTVALIVPGRTTAEDEVLLYDMAVMALQGVASALWMLRNGAIRSHRIRLSSQNRLLAQLSDIGELRLRLGAFVSSYGNASQGGCPGLHDEALTAFSDAVRELLALYDTELQELAAWHRRGLTLIPRYSAAGGAALTRKKSSGGPAESNGGAAPFSSLCSEPQLRFPTPHQSAGGSGVDVGGDTGSGAGLMGLLLCLAPLRVHLQRLADVCMCVPDPAWIPPHTQGSASRARVGIHRDEGAAGTLGAPPARVAMPQLAPSLWQVYGFPQGPELLDRLYGALLQTDHAKTPLLRLLFTATCTPYVRRIRAWMYDRLKGGATGAADTGAGSSHNSSGGNGGGVASPPTPPSFMAPLQRLLTAAGLQMQLLEELSGDVGDIAARFRKMAAAEAEEAQLIAQQYDEALTPPLNFTSVAQGNAAGPADPFSSSDVALLPGVLELGLRASDGATSGAVGTVGITIGTSGGRSKGPHGASAATAAPSSQGGQGPAEDEFNYPLVFGLEALQQLSEAAATAAAARDSELSSLLTMLDRRRKAVAEAADQHVMAAMQATLAKAEAARAAKAAAAQERRLVRSRLLAEQRAEMDERSARARTERERRIAEEQALAAEAVLKEHNEAAAALAAELARLRASYGGASYSEGAAAAGAAAVAAGTLLADERAVEAAARLRRCEWREARMALAARRRLLWQGIQAEELAQLRALVATARSAQAAAVPDADAAAAAEPQSRESDGGGTSTEGGRMLGADNTGTVLPSTAAKAVEADEVDAGRMFHMETAAAVSSSSAAVPLPPPGQLAIPRSPHEANPAALLFGSFQSSPAGTPRQCAGGPTAPSFSIVPTSTLRILAGSSAASPRLISSPKSSRGSPAIVAHFGGPRRATFHDSGPSIASPSLGGGPGGLALPSPARRARVSDGGGPDMRTPLRDVGQRPMGNHAGSARRSHSLTGHMAFAAAMSPSASVPAFWDAGPGSNGAGSDIAGPTDPFVRATGTSQGGLLRPPSPGPASRQGPPRGYMPSAWGAGGRGPAGWGGAAGGLLLELQSRQSRRRWALPEAGGGGSGTHAVMPTVTPFLIQPSQSLGMNLDEAEPPLRRQQSGGFHGVAGGKEATAPALDAAPQKGQPPGSLSSTDAAAVAVWASAWSGAGTAAGAPTGVGGAGFAPNDISYMITQDVVAGGKAQSNRRAVWKLPGVATTGSGAVYSGTSTVGILPSSISAVNPSAFQQTQSSQRLLSPRYHYTAADSWRDPVKVLLRDYMDDSRVENCVQGIHTPPRRGGGRTTDVRSQSPQRLSGRVLFACDTNRDIPDLIDLKEGAVGSGNVSALWSRRGPLSEDLAYAPIGVAIQTCLYGTVMAQYRLTTRAIWHILVDEYRLLQYCEALRRFFFCEAGDVAGALADSLTRRVEAKPHVPPSTAELRAMLDEALQGCSMLPAGGRGGAAVATTATRLRSNISVAGAAGGGGSIDVTFGKAEQENASIPAAVASTATASQSLKTGGVLCNNICHLGDDAGARVVQLLRVRSVPRRILGTGSYFASDVLYVTSQVPPPLDAVITPNCMRDYADVFSLLLRVCCAASVLTACWSRLNAATGPLVARELSGDRRGERRRHRRSGGGAVAASGMHTLWQKRLAIARLWLQAASQVVALLRQHLQVELQSSCWEELASALQGPTPQDLIQMREAHFRYLAGAREVCMLPPRDACGPDPLSANPEGPPATTNTTTTGSAVQAAHVSTRTQQQQHQEQQQQQQQQLQSLPASPLMDVLQGASALAAVLRRALTALDAQASSSSESAGLSVPPRQPTVSPVLSAVSRAAQAASATASDGGSSGSRGIAVDMAEIDGSYTLSDRVAANDLDELWAHVVVCQGRLGRALGALYGALRRGALAGGGGEGGGLIGEMMAVLSSEPCRAFLETSGGGSRSRS